jgi:hypothetical protein
MTLPKLIPGILLAGLAITSQAPAASGPEATVQPTRTQTADPPEATVKVLEANYCFAKFHGLEPERLPVPPLILQLKVQVLYHDGGPRPLILPLDHDVTVYTALKPGLMKILPKGASLTASKLKLMDHLPPDVSPQSPVNPPNDVFTIIPAGGDMNPPLVEELTVPIYKKSMRQQIDLRGRKLYLKLQLDHQPMSAQLEAAMSDRWTRYGVPWTGRLRTATLLLDIPASLPAAKECVDVPASSYPHRGLDALQGAQTK